MTATYSRPDGKNRFQIASASERPLFSAWLDQEFNALYGVVNGDRDAKETWIAISGTYTRISSTSFSVSGDMTSDFAALLPIQFNGNDTYTYIKASSYSGGVTTVVVYDGIVPSTINKVAVGIRPSSNEWSVITGTYSQTDGTTFTVMGNMTSVFEPLRAIQFTDANNVTSESNIQSSSYSSGTDTTTVVVYSNVDYPSPVPANIAKVAVGLISTASATIPSVNVATKTANYTVGAKDQIILADDSNAYTGTMMYDDNALTTDTGYPALLITLPQASVLPNKLLCVKKIAGSYRTIVLSHFNRTTVTEADGDHYNYLYDFQILGDNEAKNRVELKGIGECIWFVSNGTNWYELSPEATEIEKGLVRFATSEEMTLTAQQIADGEDLPKNLAVSPYQADKEFLRTDASNMRFASNYIYTAPNGTAALINYNIIVYKDLGMAAPDGRDDNGVCKTVKYELPSNLQVQPSEVTSKVKLMFVSYDSQTDSYSLVPILSKNYYEGYSQPVITDTTSGEEIIWFDFTDNLLKQSIDNGTNWTRFYGAGPICSFSGDGTNTTNLTAYQPVAFLTRDSLQNIYQQAIANMRPDYENAVSGSAASAARTQVSTDSMVYIQCGFSFVGNTAFYVASDSSSAGVSVGYYSYDRDSNTANFGCCVFVPKGWYFYATSSSTFNYSYSIYPLKGGIL